MGAVLYSCCGSRGKLLGVTAHRAPPSCCIVLKHGSQLGITTRKAALRMYLCCTHTNQLYTRCHQRTVLPEYYCCCCCCCYNEPLNLACGSCCTIVCIPPPPTSFLQCSVLPTGVRHLRKTGNSQNRARERPRRPTANILQRAFFVGASRLPVSCRPTPAGHTLRTVTNRCDESRACTPPPNETSFFCFCSGLDVPHDRVEGGGGGTI